MAKDELHAPRQTEGSPFLLGQQAVWGVSDMLRKSAVIGAQDV